MLIIVSDSSIRIFLLFINFPVWLFVFSRRHRVLLFGISAQITGQTDPSLWGKTLPQFENGRADTAYGS
jgi:hypothetical protein